MIGRIPTCDIIDFDYPAWHTTRDVPAQCSAESLAAVGDVLLAWLREQR
jgi:glutaminyl-peptide cyclotransferase